MERAVLMSFLKNKLPCNIIMIFIYRLVDTSQMLGEIERFHYNRNVHNVSWYGKLNFFPGPHLIWGIDYRIRGKEFLIVLKNVHGKSRKFLFIYLLFEKVSGPMSSKVDVMKLL